MALALGSQPDLVEGRVQMMTVKCYIEYFGLSLAIIFILFIYLFIYLFLQRRSY
jgi:hypothetical protein